MKFIKYISIAVFAIFAVSCNDDDDLPTTGEADTDFTGTFAQEDQMGRPGINTVFTSEPQSNTFNVTQPEDQIAAFQPIFLNTVQTLYGAYGATYENNILGLDAATTTTALALDVLQVAPEGTTLYFNPDTGVPFTGRTLSDDVIDVSLIVLFGGESGARFDGGEGDGDDDDGDDSNNVPNLVSDNVGVENGAVSDTFPYLRGANF